jgi:hypothetical protein
MTTTWHVSDVLLERWISGPSAIQESTSVEQHLVACEQCRDRVRIAVGSEVRPPLLDLELVWGRVRDSVELPRPSWFERTLRRLGLSAQDARLIAVTPAFRGPWFMGVLVVLGFAELAAQFGHARGELFFLAIAPLLPCLAVAFSYDPGVDPALEQDLAAPYSALRLVVLRTVAVLSAAIPAVVLLDLIVPAPAPYLWLVPAAGFVAVVLALSTWVNPLAGAGAVSAGWLAAVWWAAAGDAPVNVVLHVQFQIIYLVLIVVSTAVFVARGRHVREVRPRWSRS